MKITALYLIVTASLVYPCFSQNMEELLYASMREAIAEIKAVSQRVTGSQNDLQIKMQELHDRMATIEGQLVKLQGSSKQDSTLAIFKDILESERDLQKDLLDRNCNVVDQLTELQINLSTDECAENSHNCSPLALCEDAIISYRCNCMPGYAGNGVSCEDINECSVGGDSCHDYAICTNVPGSYTCACRPGYSGDGFSCEDIDECGAGRNRCHDYANCSNVAGSYTCACRPGYSGDGFSCEGPKCGLPSKSLPTLGCITPVKQLLSRDAAQENCRANGGRLLEGISAQTEFHQLREHFRSLFDTNNVWVGIGKGRWVESGKPIHPSTLWDGGRPTGGDEECGYVLLSESPYLGDCSCSSYTWPSLCQRTFPRE